MKNPKELFLFSSLSIVLITLILIRSYFSVNVIINSILVVALVYISITDLKTMIIPNKAVGFIAILGVILIATDFSYQRLLYSIAGFLLGGGLFLIIAIATKGAMGGGDIKLMAALGFFFALYHITLIIFLSFWIAAVASIFLLLAKKKAKKDSIPFGPFIAIAAYITLLYGDKIISFYTTFII